MSDCAALRVALVSPVEGEGLAAFDLLGGVAAGMDLAMGAAAETWIGFVLTVGFEVGTAAATGAGLAGVFAGSFLASCGFALVRIAGLSAFFAVLSGSGFLAGALIITAGFLGEGLDEDMDKR